MRHVAHRVNVYQHADAGDEQQPDARKRVEQEASISLIRLPTALRSDTSLTFGVVSQ